MGITVPFLTIAEAFCLCRPMTGGRGQVHQVDSKCVDPRVSS